MYIQISISTQSAPRLAMLICGLILVGIAVAASGARIDVPGYVGNQACGGCHQSELNAWRGSHHDLAMTEPTEQTMLGDFDNAEFTAHGVDSTFFRRDDGWYVRTDGPDQNLDITTGDWRIINLEKAPFNLPEPIKIINEKCTEANGSYADKSLGLWKLQQL
jgi:hypothetical protein